MLSFFIYIAAKQTYRYLNKRILKPITHGQLFPLCFIEINVRSSITHQCMARYDVAASLRRLTVATTTEAMYDSSCSLDSTKIIYITELVQRTSEV